MRAHNGVLFTHQGFSWRTFEGFLVVRPPQRIKAEMVALEGLFRELGAATGRDRDSILRRMVALRGPRGVEDDPAIHAQWFEHLRASAPALEPPRDGADDGPAHGSPWTMQVVKAIIKCSGEMQNDHCGKRLVGNFLKWCDTPLIRKPGFSTTDGCWLFDEIEGDVRFVVPHAERWARAASARTCLLANLFGGSHGFKDMNVFFSEDKLRKQADTFTGKVNGEHHLGHENSRCPGFFFGRIGPTVCSSGRHHGPGGPQNRQKAPRRPSQEGDERGPGGRPSPVRHLDEDGHIFGLEEVRDERDSKVPRGYGNDGPVDEETISHHHQL